MKRSRIVETKYKGYLIEPSLQGFKVYRKEYYIDEYPTLKIAKEKIDRVIAMKQRGQDVEPPPAKSEDESDQMTFF
ncbi:MAG: hypothetical protein E2O77_02640 [Caldithrix sp.]|nr:MAG: hypothetical protein E2O77_02640 [Caldithrix sp.]